MELGGKIKALQSFGIVSTEPLSKAGVRKIPVGAYTVLLIGLGVRGCVLKHLCCPQAEAQVIRKLYPPGQELWVNMLLADFWKPDSN